MFKEYIIANEDQMIKDLGEMIKITKQSLRNRDRVMIRSFGTFVVRHKNPKQIRGVQ